ncbi:MAG: disulfide oxidoreductase, partial [Roseovarius sp.]|nr:disulfide oxidoreductase [Roseovarius sp.]
ERGEREKVKPVDKALAEAPADAVAATEEGAPDTAADIVETIADEGVAPITADPAPEPQVPAKIPETAEAETAPGETPEVAAPEIEVFYTFTWAPRANRARPERPAGGGHRDKPAKSGKPRGKPGKGKPRGAPQEQGAKSFSARPEKKDRIDPDNPFAAALMGLKTKG